MAKKNFAIRSECQIGTAQLSRGDVQSVGQAPRARRVLMLAVLAVIAICWPEGGFSQTNAGPLQADTRIAGPALMEDVDILEQAYKTMHAGLYRYNSPAEMDLKFDELRERLKSGATLAESYLALLEFATAIRCGHTYPNFFNQPKAVVNALFTGTNRLPFEFRWLGERMFISRNLSPDAMLAPGTEILAINGIPAREVLRRLMKVARADGGNDAKRRALLEVQGVDRYEPFDIYYALFFPLRPPQFELSVRQFGAATNATVLVNPLSYAARLAAIKVSPEKMRGDDAVWTLSFLNDRTALLKMPSWALYNSKWDWKQFLTETFSNLNNHAHCNLIIDLRDNEGGITDVGYEIARHLIRKDIATGGTHRYIRFRTAPKNLIPYLDTWDWGFLDWSTNTVNPAFQPAGNAVYYSLIESDNNNGGDVLHPLAPRFDGKVVVLMNSENSSATFIFEQLAQQNKLATLIGEPSGGNRRGINGGAFFFLNLPNSKIEMDLPLVATLPSTPQPDAGLLPDKDVSITPHGLATGKDEVLAAALKYLHAGKVRQN